MQKLLVGTAIWACLSGFVAAQTIEPAGPPPLIPFSGAITAPSGGPHVGLVSAVFALYEASEGGVPLWVDIQVVQTDADGWYLALLGAYTALPVDLFASSQALWLGVQPEGQPEQPRVQFLSVPYALKAGDADTLGGRPVGEFMLLVDASSDGDGSGGAKTAAPLSTESGDSLVSNTRNLVENGDLTVHGQSNLLGNVVLGTTSPGTILEVQGDTDNNNQDDAQISITGATANAKTLSLGFNTARDYGFIQASEYGVDHRPLALNPEAGNVGIGTTTPSATLHVAGDLKIDGNIAAKYQDVAEWVEAVGALPPGTVVVADLLRRNVVKIAEAPYDAAVLGAVSLQPGLILGEAGPNRVLVAQSGRVMVKVDASYGPIAVGDLLVTSATAGHARRSAPLRLGDISLHRPGTVLGKALEPLETGRGEILVLITLQ